MGNQEMEGTATVPVWAANLQASVAEIKARTDLIPELQKDVKSMEAGMVPMGEHSRLMARVDTLWDKDQRRDGELQARARNERFWRLGLTVGMFVLAAWTLLQNLGVSIRIH